MFLKTVTGKTVLLAAQVLFGHMYHGTLSNICTKLPRAKALLLELLFSGTTAFYFICIIVNMVRNQGSKIKKNK